ncbi:MAG: HD family phosphohydrolase [Acidobacteriota bacterium]
MSQRVSKLEKVRRTLAAGLSYLQAVYGLGISIAITLLLIGSWFQDIPDFQIGDVSDRTIEAPDDFTVSDFEATSEKKQESLTTVPAVFDLDLRVNNRIEMELRSGFGRARELIAKYRERAGIPQTAPLTTKDRAEVLKELKEKLSTFDRAETLKILLDHGFSPKLEDQMVRMLQLALKHPGVAATRDMLLIYQGRGIVLFNTITRQDEVLNDWTAIRDIGQARDVLRQEQYELTEVAGEEKRGIIRFLDQWVVPNVYFNEAETRAREALAMSEVDPVLIQIKKGRTIVRKGDAIGPRELMILEELRSQKQAEQPTGRFVGVFLIVIFFMYTLWQYFWAHQRQHQSVGSHYQLVTLVLIVNLLLARLLTALAKVVAGNLNAGFLQNPYHFYFVIPVALGAILIILLVDAQLCIIYALTFAVFLALMTGEMSMGIYSLVGSLTAIYALRQYRERSAIVRAGLIIGLVNILLVLSLQLYSQGFEWTTFAVRSLAGFLSGSFAAMLASLLLPMLETLFSITTDIRLLELSSLNKPILRRLAVQAPGTYHHSILVGTLAESAAEAIGANPVLVRAGAYYHDIGKLRKPEYYVENQIFMANKHEGLSPNMSSLILASHVKDGLAMANEINLTPKVRDLIPQHHGTRLMTYFFQKAKEAADGKHCEVTEADFRYPGPKPQSKEAAILMLADQVEAASRTLQEPSPSQIRSLIRRLIQSTIQDRQFDECDITMKDLEKILTAFERVISGMYHHPIEYPGFDFNKRVAQKQEPDNQRLQ